MSQSQVRQAVGVALFVALFALYNADWKLLLAGDSVANVYTTLSLLYQRNVMIDPAEAPLLFEWELQTQEGPKPVFIPRMDEALRGMFEDGSLKVARERYQVVSVKDSGKYINTFGLGASVTALPFFTALHLYSGDLREHPIALWKGARLVGAFCVAGSALFVYLIACLYLRCRYAIYLTLIYGLGTCVWTQSALGLWQHGPNLLYLSMGSYFLLHPRRTTKGAGLSGMFFALAACCRPTSALVGAAVAAYYGLSHRKHAWACVIAAAPIAVLLFASNTMYHGSPFKFGQTRLEAHAIEKTGSPEIFQTPLWEGALGSLFSPARGLFIYSPFLLFSLYGSWVVFRHREWGAFRPLVAGTLLIWAVEFQHFDWWGGWSFGYRHLVDTSLALVLLLIPVFASIWSEPNAKAIFGTFVAYAIFVQTLGALAYDNESWNARRAYVVEIAGKSIAKFDRQSQAQRYAESIGGIVMERDLDIDKPEYRYRLWSLSDQPILYLLDHFSESRMARRIHMAPLLDLPEIPLAVAYSEIARAYHDADEVEKASQALKSASKLNADSARLKQWLGKIDARDDTRTEGPRNR